MPDAAASYTFQDHSGVPTSSKPHSNPYQDLITHCNDDPAQVQAKYATHREKRAEQQRQKLLADDFDGMVIDPILKNLVGWPGFEDPRKCLVFWARPTQDIRALIAKVQQRLLEVAPAIWTMPQECLHMTVLEIAHSRTDDQIDKLVSQLRPAANEMTDYTATHRARLVKPMIVYDAQGVALSFLPAAGEDLSGGRSADDDEYTYHHLRRDVHAMSVAAGVEVGSRYVVPSAHLTIARFIDAEEFQAAGQVDRKRVRRLVEVLDQTNEWLRAEYWPTPEQPARSGGQWLVGQDKGLDFRAGPLWYGGGETIRIGKGY